MSSRRRLPIDPGIGIGVVLESYPNVPRTIAAVISSGLATLAECQTVYGLEDLYDMMEVSAVNAHNRDLLAQHRRRGNAPA